MPGAEKAKPRIRVWYLHMGLRFYSMLTHSIRVHEQYGTPDPYVLLIWEFPKIRGTFFGVLIIRILLFRVLY